MSYQRGYVGTRLGAYMGAQPQGYIGLRKGGALPARPGGYMGFEHPPTYSKAGTDANAAATVAETAALYTGDGTTSLLDVVLRNGALPWTADATNAADFVVSVYDSGANLVAAVPLATTPTAAGDLAAGGVLQWSATPGGPFQADIPLLGYVTFQQIKLGAGVLLGPYDVDLYIGDTPP